MTSTPVGNGQWWLSQATAFGVGLFYGRSRENQLSPRFTGGEISLPTADKGQWELEPRLSTAAQEAGVCSLCRHPPPCVCVSVTLAPSLPSLRLSLRPTHAAGALGRSWMTAGTRQSVRGQAGPGRGKDRDGES